MRAHVALCTGSRVFCAPEQLYYGDGISNNPQIDPPAALRCRRTSLPKPHGDKVFPARPPRRYGERVTRNLWAIRISRKRSRAIPWIPQVSMFLHSLHMFKLTPCAFPVMVSCGAGFGKEFQVFPSLAAFPRSRATSREPSDPADSAYWLRDRSRAQRQFAG